MKKILVDKIKGIFCYKRKTLLTAIMHEFFWSFFISNKNWYWILFSNNPKENNILYSNSFALADIGVVLCNIFNSYRFSTDIPYESEECDKTIL